MVSTQKTRENQIPKIQLLCKRLETEWIISKLSLVWIGRWILFRAGPLDTLPCHPESIIIIIIRMPETGVLQHPASLLLSNLPRAWLVPASLHFPLLAAWLPNWLSQVNQQNKFLLQKTCNVLISYQPGQTYKQLNKMFSLKYFVISGVNIVEHKRSKDMKICGGGGAEAQSVYPDQDDTQGTNNLKQSNTLLSSQLQTTRSRSTI